ncbi:sensor histidine kinase [Streptomyces sp. CRN 30]|uniref:sensor histidine kinase n=1 Tax=Streptomyces sp. CRN 30 TaxID=3075613 RepID=UPI002A83E56D|nr:sensor histidine kinase [Streptomyces sp. CRN 30]
MRGPRTRWREKSTAEKVEAYTRWSFQFLPLVEIFSLGLSPFGSLPLASAGWIFALVTVHATMCMVTVDRALDWACGRRAQPVRLLALLGATTAVVGIATLVLAKHGPDRPETAGALGATFIGVLGFGLGFMALGLRERKTVHLSVAGFTAGTAVVAFVMGFSAPSVMALSLGVVVAGGFTAFISIFSLWMLHAVYELHEARDTLARLAVAEERLRFGRDLHDVMGRNLAVIALKSELAVQLARRQRPESLEQMIEVQRIAQETQSEVRAVVRGYRAADLSAEFAGARGVLTAAGIRCEVTGSAQELPQDVQSALGWVVREATTNVLRHGNAVHCSVSLRKEEDRVVLTVENDGALESVPPGGSRGSGLAGLRERLSAVDGTLHAGPSADGLFRVTAEVPLPDARPHGRRKRSETADGNAPRSAAADDGRPLMNTTATSEVTP